jgi:hypothetical protein
LAPARFGEKCAPRTASEKCWMSSRTCQDRPRRPSGQTLDRARPTPGSGWLPAQARCDEVREGNDAAASSRFGREEPMTVAILVADLASYPRGGGIGHPVVPHPRAGQVKITRTGRGIADDETSTGAAQPGSMEKPR